MAAMVASLFAAIGTGAATAATAGSAATAVAATGTAVAATGSSVLSILQGLSTGISVLSAVGGGLSSYFQGQQSSELSDISGEQERLNSEERALRIEREEAIKIGASRVAFAGSGIDISGGTSAAVEDNITAQSKFETSIERRNGRVREIQSRLRSSSQSSSGMMTLVSGILKGGSAIVDNKIDASRRG